jgi:hypothetical protein
MRPLWTNVREEKIAADVRLQAKREGISDAEARVREALAAERAKSIRLNRSKRLIPREREVPAIPAKRVGGTVKPQLYKYGGDIEIAEGTGRIIKGERGIKPGSARRFYVTFGSDRPLTRDEVEERIIQEWERMEGRYQRSYGLIRVGQVRITQADKLRLRRRRRVVRRKR